MNILVTGATGTVGGSLVEGLLQRKENVSVLMRDVNKKSFPPQVIKVKGDLTDVNTWKSALEGVDALFLLLTPDGNPDIIQAAESAGVKKLVALSDGTQYPTEDALYQSNLNWTMLFPVEFMKNTLIFWRDSIRKESIARTPFPDSKSAMIHEEDIAEAAETVLLEAGHEGKSYYLTGPEATTPITRIRDIEAAIGKSVTVLPQTEAEAREEYAQMGFPPALIDFAIESTKNPEPYMYTVLPTVEQLTGHPARSFAQWAREHRADFVD